MVRSHVKPIRPNFERPPLAEQAISLLFDPIEQFRIVDYGLYWQQIADQFPHVSSDAPIEAPVEHFGGFRPTDIQFKLLTVPPLPRASFSGEAGELVVVQPDRFGFNWAKVGDAAYPRSEKLMERFRELFAGFASYVEKQRLGGITFRQCELTNLNVIPVADFGIDFADMANAFRVDPLDLGVDFLRAETYIRNRQHVILGDGGQPVGRLHMNISPVVSTHDQSKAFRFELTARSGRQIDSVAAADKFFELARDAINGAFLATVTEKMKGIWGEANG